LGASSSCDFPSLQNGRAKPVRGALSKLVFAFIALVRLMQME
jgi:hypothetical protein